MAEDKQICITLTLEDDTELECPVIDVFDAEGREYIALLHPEEETALLYRFYENDDESVNIESIEDDDEFEKVSKAFTKMLEDAEKEVEETEEEK